MSEAQKKNLRSRLDLAAKELSPGFVDHAPLVERVVREVISIVEEGRGEELKEEFGAGLAAVGNDTGCSKTETASVLKDMAANACNLNRRDRVALWRIIRLKEELRGSGTPGTQEPASLNAQERSAEEELNTLAPQPNREK